MLGFIADIIVFIIVLAIGRALFGLDPSLGEMVLLVIALVLGTAVSDAVEGR